MNLSNNNFSAALLIIRSALQYLYYIINKKEYLPTENMINGDNYARSLTNKLSLIPERRGLFSQNNINIYFCIDAINEKENDFIEITFCVFMSGGHSTNLIINRKLSARLHKHTVSSSFNYGTENYFKRTLLKS